MCELSPCPFCGKQPELDVQTIRSDGRAWTFIWCKSVCGVKPHASGSADTFFYNSATHKSERYRTNEEATLIATEHAVKRWNTRKVDGK